MGLPSRRKFENRGYYYPRQPKFKDNKKIYKEEYLWEFVGNGYKTAPPIRLAKKINKLNKGSKHSYISLIRELTGGKCNDVKLSHGLLRACEKHYPDMRW